MFDLQIPKFKEFSINRTLILESSNMKWKGGLNYFEDKW